MRVAAWAATVMLGGCFCGPTADDLEATAADVIDVRWQKPDAGPPPIPPRPVPPPCVVTPHPRTCAGGGWVFDGQTCRPGCAPVVAEGGAAYADEVSCIKSCQCATDKWRLDFLPTTECQYVYSVGSLDAGVPTGCRALSLAYNCIYEFPLDGGTSFGGGITGPLIGTEGVRLACELSLLPGVESVSCSVWGE